MARLSTLLLKIKSAPPFVTLTIALSEILSLRSEYEVLYDAGRTGNI